MNLQTPRYIASGKAYNPNTNDWTTPVVWTEARNRMEALNWVRMNRDWFKDLRIDGEPV